MDLPALPKHNMVPILSLELNLDYLKQGLRLVISSCKKNTLFDAQGDCEENLEARYQLLEGCYYDYSFNSSSFMFELDMYQIVQQNIISKHTGRLSPNIYVGNIRLLVINKTAEETFGHIELEVQSIKSDYRVDYRNMLDYIAENCVDILLDANTLSSQRLEVDETKSSQTKYQQFAFLRSIIGTIEFSDAINKVISSPSTRWENFNETIDTRQAKRISNINIKEIIRGRNRTKLPNNHKLNLYNVDSVPARITSTLKDDSLDTSENRFIKHVLETFFSFCDNIRNTKGISNKLFREANFLTDHIELFLHNPFFKGINRPNSLQINSPVLQRKEGYREVLKVWLTFDMAARLIWTGGNDVYSGGKKDVANLYEYWVFFILLNLFKEIFTLDKPDISSLIKETTNGLNLQLKQGNFTVLKGVYETGNRKLNIRFYYNRTFPGNQKYPQPGSWTTTLRPDYTLTIWPLGIDESEAEKQELIIHIHFDAKYKIANLLDLINENNTSELDEEKIDNKKGNYKNADLLKMHSYKDAIRRSAGAYILYPGHVELNRNGFHEIIPGLGAFPLRPSKSNSGIKELKSFILEVVDHSINRASQREKLAYRTYDIYKTAPKRENAVRESLPEPYGKNRALIPDDTFVLISYCQSENEYNWTKDNSLLAIKLGSENQSLVLNKELVSSKYLLLCSTNQNISGDFWNIIGASPTIHTHESLEKFGYPESDYKSYYLVLSISPTEDTEFSNSYWHFKNLAKYSGESLLPFTVSLSELMNNKVNGF